MKRSFIRNSLALSAALAAFVLISCILGGDKTAGRRGSEVENEIYGVLVDEGGIRVQGARVLALPAARAAASGDTDTVVTDADGRYAFESLDAGRYDLYGDYGSGSLVVLIPGIDVAAEAKLLDLGVDTLRAPGGIAGRMLAGSQGKAGVLCFVPGLSRLDVSDDSGRFLIQGLPQGRYSLRYSAAGFLIAPDSGIAVQAGRITQLPDKLLEYDPALPPPGPFGLKAVYDTLNQRVTLTWDAVPVSDFEGFVVYRDAPDALAPVILRNGFTVFPRFEDASFGDSLLGRDLTYRIKARDHDANLSLNYSNPATVKIVPRAQVATLISVIVPEARAGAVSIGDSLRVIAAYRNPGRRIRMVSWRLGGGEAVRSRAVSAFEGADTLGWKAGGAGWLDFRVEMKDETGVAWTSRLALQVTDDPPRAMAGRDTLVTVGDTLSLRGSGEDGFGKIVRWEWDIGGTGVFREGRPDTLIRAPDSAGVYACVLRVTDDDGKQAYDTLIVTTERRARKWHKAGRCLPGMGNFNDFRLVDFAGRLWLFSGRDNPTGSIWSSADAQVWEEVPGLFSRPTVGVIPIVFKGRLYAIGGGAELAGVAEIWSTADGKHWDIRNAPAGFGAMQFAAAAEFNGELWVVGGISDGAISPNIWHTRDGADWIKEPGESLGWQLAPALVKRGDRLLLVGRYQDGGPWGNRAVIWSSSNGVDWAVASVDPPPDIGYKQIADLGGRLTATWATDVWTSVDGTSWSREDVVYPYDPFTTRNGGLAVFGGRIYMAIAADGDDIGDFWYLE